MISVCVCVCVWHNCLKIADTTVQNIIAHQYTIVVVHHRVRHTQILLAYYVLERVHAYMRACVRACFISVHVPVHRCDEAYLSVGYIPFAVRFKRVHGYRGTLCGQVHLGCVIRPGAKHQVAFLLVEWVIRNVNLAHGLKHAPRLPSDTPIRENIGLEIPVIPVDTFRSESNCEKQETWDLNTENIGLEIAAILVDAFCTESNCEKQETWDLNAENIGLEIAVIPVEGIESNCEKEDKLDVNNNLSVSMLYVAVLLWNWTEHYSKAMRRGCRQKTVV